jgi:protein-S-isoprenylcysteine O-methyltransferase Ste14
MLIIQWVTFFLVTIVLTYISRASLRRPRSHGFYRFFAWEFILALFLRNIPIWFSRPFAWHQLISWSLLVICCVPVILGAQRLKRAGKPKAQGPTPQRQDEPLFEFEKTTALITDGIYHYIRHPLYSSLMLLAWGIFFKRPDPSGLLLALAASLCLAATASSEEKENIDYFGPAYQEYMRRTRRFIPFLF